MKTINTLTLIFTTAFVFQFSNLFAGNDGAPTNSNNALNSTYATLAPTVPAVASFEDDATFDFNQLMPATPTEATFEDMTSEMTSFVNLAPVTPAFADFDDAYNGATADFLMLVPVTPFEADFE